MTELSFDYWNTLASQMVVISSLMGGFSLSLLFSLPENPEKTRINTYIFKAATIATASFLVSIFALTKILLMTTKGFPFAVTGENLILPRIVATSTFFTGILSVITLIALSGWNKSLKTKRFTMIVGIVMLVLILAMIS
jgi:hypothetical protein